MRIFFISLGMFTASTSGLAADFEVSKKCRALIQEGLVAHQMTLTRIHSTDYILGGSDGLESWSSEYKIDASVIDKDGDESRVLIYINDNDLCRVLRVLD